MKPLHLPGLIFLLGQEIPEEGREVEEFSEDDDEDDSDDSEAEKQSQKQHKEEALSDGTSTASSQQQAPPQSVPPSQIQAPPMPGPPPLGPPPAPPLRPPGPPTGLPPGPPPGKSALLHCEEITKSTCDQSDEFIPKIYIIGIDVFSSPSISHKEIKEVSSFFPTALFTVHSTSDSHLFLQSSSLFRVM